MKKEKKRGKKILFRQNMPFVQRPRGGGGSPGGGGDEEGKRCINEVPISKNKKNNSAQSAGGESAVRVGPSGSLLAAAATWLATILLARSRATRRRLREEGQSGARSYLDGP